MSVNSLVAGVYKCETSIWKRSEANFTNRMIFFFFVTWMTWLIMPSRLSCGSAPGVSRWCWADLTTWSWITDWNFFSMASDTLEENQMFDSNKSSRSLFDPVFLPGGANIFHVNVPRPRSGQFSPLECWFPHWAVWSSQCWRWTGPWLRWRCQWQWSTLVVLALRSLIFGGAL